MNNATLNLRTGIESAWTMFMNFIPNFLLFVAILVVGYFIARLLARALEAFLHKVGFERVTERAWPKQALAKSNWTASKVAGAVLFWTLFLFVLQLAFGVFGPNPINQILLGIIAFLPNIFAAIAIIVVAAFVARVTKGILEAALGNLVYKRFAANAVSAAILALGIFAALVQLQIAPAIVLGLFYAMLAVIVGSAIISIGIGGITPMRAEWERALGKVRQEAPNIKAAVSNAPQRPAESAPASFEAGHEHEEVREVPRFPIRP
jgi:hypothetical protein